MHIYFFPPEPPSWALQEEEESVRCSICGNDYGIISPIPESGICEFCAEEALPLPA